MLPQCFLDGTEGVFLFVFSSCHRTTKKREKRRRKVTPFQYLCLQTIILAAYIGYTLRLLPRRYHTLCASVLLGQRLIMICPKSMGTMQTNVKRTAAARAMHLSFKREHAAICNGFNGFCLGRSQSKCSKNMQLYML